MSVEGDDAEYWLRDYMVSIGWEYNKLDEDTKESAADWLFTKQNNSIVCEVKTIQSVLRGVNTDGDVDKEGGLRRRIRHLSHMPDFSKLPFNVLIHNQYLYAPTSLEVSQFIEWLKMNLELIYLDEVPIHWQMYSLFQKNYYFARYKTNYKYGLDVFVRPRDTRVLYQYDMNTYGSLNTRPIEKEISKARQQLNATKNIALSTPKIIVISFSKGIDFFHYLKIFKEFYKALQKYPEISAIVLIRFEMIDDLFENTLAFSVFHNYQTCGFTSLSKSVFDSHLNKQYDMEDIKELIYKMSENDLFI